VRQHIVDALGSGASFGGHAPQRIVSAANDAFVSALSTGLLVGAIVTLCGAVVAWSLIARKIKEPAPAADAAREGEDAATEVSLV
jgi:hypothetical protein